MSKSFNNILKVKININKIINKDFRMDIIIILQLKLLIIRI